MANSGETGRLLLSLLYFFLKKRRKKKERKEGKYTSNDEINFQVVNDEISLSSGKTQPLKFNRKITHEL